LTEYTVPFNSSGELETVSRVTEGTLEQMLAFKTYQTHTNKEKAITWILYTSTSYEPKEKLKQLINVV